MPKSGFVPLLLALALWDAGRLLANDKNGVSPQVISLPSGPGSINGLGESFQPQLNSGGGSYGIPIVIPPGTNGHAPSISLQYSSGSGNGPCGIGWQLTGAPSIERNTDCGVPRYVDGPNSRDDDGDGNIDNVEEVDRFTGMDREELVPLADGSYRAETEGGFFRYHRVGDGWRVESKSGIVYEFGSTTPLARVEESGHIFRWLVERVTDLHGNLIRYTYFADPSSPGQKYLQEVRWSPAGASALYAVAFCYGSDQPGPCKESNRPDVYSDYRGGFEVRTGLRLTRIDVIAQGLRIPDAPLSLKGDLNADGISDALIRRYRIDYVQGAMVSLIQRVTLFGSDGITSLPPTTFDYTPWDPPNDVAALIRTSTGEPHGIDLNLESVELVDLNRDGLPDLLSTFDSNHRVYLNRGIDETGKLAWETAGKPIPDAPRLDLASTDVHLADLNGDGIADLVHKATTTSLRFYSNTGECRWQTPEITLNNTDSWPIWPFDGPNGPASRTLDIDHNRHDDILYTGPAGYQLWMLLPNGQYAKEKRPSVLTAGSQVFRFNLPGTHVADLNGDRLQDLAWVQNSRVVYWPSRGYGDFGDPVFLPLGVSLSSMDLERSGFADLNGDGLADLTIVRPTTLLSGIFYWINRGQAGMDPLRKLIGLPATRPGDALRWADMDGNGSNDILISNSTQGSQIISLVPGVRPNLLSKVDNGIGLTIEIEYKTSVDQMIAATREGTPWKSTMPISVPVVSKLTEYDGLGNQKVRKFVYRDPYYDPEKQEFRGFSQTMEVEVGDASAPSLATRSVFDTGQEKPDLTKNKSRALKGRLLRRTTAEAVADSFPDDRSKWFSDESTSWQRKGSDNIKPAPRVLATDKDGHDVVFAHPVSKKTEIIEFGQGTPRMLESEFEFDDFGNQTVNRNFGIVEGDDRSVFDDERITETEFAYNIEKWVIGHPKRTRIQDENGKIISQSEFFYDDETFSGGNFGNVTKGDLTLKRDWIDPQTLSAFIDTRRAKYDPYGNAILLLDPLSIDASAGHYRELMYDSAMHIYPESEEIHLESGKKSLLFQAGYHFGFGTVTSSVDFNGHQTEYGYDALARLTMVLKPGDHPDYPTTEYSYILGQPAGNSKLINYVETRLIDRPPWSSGSKRDHYFITRKFVDGLGRQVLSKSEAEPDPGTGRPRVVVSGAAIFNLRQKPYSVLQPFYTLVSGETLDDLLGFEDIRAEGWTGLFHENGQLIPLGLAQAHATSTSYDATLRPLETRNPDRSFSRVIHEPLVDRVFDENDTDPDPLAPHRNTPMIHYRDGLGRQIQTDDVVKINDDGTPSQTLNTWTTRFEYDLNDQITRIVDSASPANEKVIRYDGLKRKTGMNDPDRGRTVFEYDAASNLKRVVAYPDTKSERVISYTYDGANRLLTEDYHDEGRPEVSLGHSPDVEYHYDEPSAVYPVARNTHGTLSWVLDLTGAEYFSHDGRGNLEWKVKRVMAPSGTRDFEMDYVYDVQDRIRRITYPDGAEVEQLYNSRNLLEAVPGYLESIGCRCS